MLNNNWKEHPKNSDWARFNYSVSTLDEVKIQSKRETSGRASLRNGYVGLVNFITFTLLTEIMEYVEVNWWNGCLISATVCVGETENPVKKVTSAKLLRSSLNLEAMRWYGNAYKIFKWCRWRNQYKLWVKPSGKQSFFMEITYWSQVWEELQGTFQGVIISSMSDVP